MEGQCTDYFTYKKLQTLRICGPILKNLQFINSCSNPLDIGPVDNNVIGLARYEQSVHFD